METTSNLDTLPVELLELISSSLEFEDIAALRQTCRTINEKVLAGPRFATVFHRHTLFLETPYLRDAAALMRQSRVVCQLRCCDVAFVIQEEAWERYLAGQEEGLEAPAPDLYDISDLTKKAIAWEAREADNAMDEQATLLADIFESIRRWSPTQSLSQLRLRVYFRENGAAPGMDGLRLPRDSRDGSSNNNNNNNNNNATNSWDVHGPEDWNCDWRRVWHAAHHTFSTVFAALTAKSIPVVDELDLFRGRADQRSCTCCMTSDDVVAMVGSKTALWEEVFGSLKTLRLSVSTSPRRSPIERCTSVDDPVDGNDNDDSDYEDQADYDDDDDDDNDNDNSAFVDDMRIDREACRRVLLQGILPLWRQLPELQTVDLHFFHLGRAKGVPGVPSLGRWEEPPAPGEPPCEPNEEKKNHHLVECNLAGLRIPEADLVRFLLETQPATVRLTHLRCDDVSNLFAYLADPSTATTAYRLDDLLGDVDSPLCNRDGWGFVTFCVPGPCKFPLDRGSQQPPALRRLPLTLWREGRVEAKTAIPYVVRRDRPLGSGAAMRWETANHDLYGPV